MTTKNEEIIEGSTNHEVEKLTEVLSSWSPIIYMQTLDFHNFMVDISTTIKRMNVGNSSKIRTKLLWFNLSTGLFNVVLYSKTDTETEEIKQIAPNGIAFEPILKESKTVKGMTVKYKLDDLLEEYASFEPSRVANQDNPLHSSVLILNDIKKELENNSGLKHSLIHFLQQTEVLFNRAYVNRQILIVDRYIKYIPPEIERSNIIYHHGGYTNQKMIECLLNNSNNPTEKHKKAADKIANSIAGLTITEAQSTLNLMAARKPKTEKVNILDLSDDDISFLTHKRKEIINKGGILGVKDPEIAMKDIGGNELIKEFVKTQKYIYNNRFEAKEYGLHKHRGVLFLGPPGTGKSTICEAIAHELNSPYMKLDLSKIMESRVGSSEANIANAMQMAEQIGGVLQIDEIEKTLGGVDSSNKVDGGITLRIFSTILEYMARENDILFIATANDIQGLPPELTRKGRIDELFLIDYPCIDEIAEILSIHIEKSGRKVEEFLSEKEETKVINALDQYTGSEIKYIINKALRSAFLSKNKKLTFSILYDIIKDTIPMSITYREKLDQVRQWAVTTANPASSNSEFAKLRQQHFTKGK